MQIFSWEAKSEDGKEVTRGAIDADSLREAINRLSAILWNWSKDGSVKRWNLKVFQNDVSVTLSLKFKDESC